VSADSGDRYFCGHAEKCFVNLLFIETLQYLQFNEVVDMVEEDLNQQTQIYQRHIYTVDILKQQFRTLREAKDHFKLKASSWESLAKKLNDPSFQTLIPEQKPQSDQGLTNNSVRKVEHDRNEIEGLTVRLEPDVAEMFPNSQAVNEALRFLIRVTNKNYC
jgi:hypothetical protein